MREYDSATFNQSEMYPEAWEAVARVSKRALRIRPFTLTSTMDDTFSLLIGLQLRPLHHCLLFGIQLLSNNRKWTSNAFFLLYVQDTWPRH